MTIPILKIAYNILRICYCLVYVDENIKKLKELIAKRIF